MILPINFLVVHKNIANTQQILPSSSCCSLIIFSLYIIDSTGDRGEACSKPEFIIAGFDAQAPHLSTTLFWTSTHEIHLMVWL